MSYLCGMKTRKSFETMKKSAFYKSFLLVAMIGWALAGYAQGYEMDKGRVFFCKELVWDADPWSFEDLGYGYAKDRNNVYLNGRVLENVDPSSFRLKVQSGRRKHGKGQVDEPVRRGYFKTKMNVYYGEKKLDAMASSFKELGGGYAKDAFNVYYCGEKVEGAMASSFKYTGDGYGEDSFDAYFRGRKLK